MVTAKFVCSLITVADITRSRDFYEKVFGQKVEADFGENVSFGGFSIHLRAHFQNLIENKVITANANNFELYFESDDLVQTVEILKEYNVQFIHEIREMPWKQNVIRFYDPDNNIVEIGEPMTME